MTKTLFVHIGHYKTGTTALQVFCRNHPDLLGRGSVTYDQELEHLAKHSILAFSLLRAGGAQTLMHGYANETPPEELWSGLFDRLRKGSADAMLVSSEELIRIAEFPDAVARLRQIIADHGAGVDIRVIVYLRPPNDQVQSWFNQLVKMNQKVADFEGALANGQIESVHYDYAKALAPWIDIFGADAVMVRRYPERGMPPETLIVDFFGALGISITPDDARTPRHMNPRFDDRMVDLVRMVKNTDAPNKQMDHMRRQIAEFLEAQGPASGREGALANAEQTANAALAELSQRLGQDLSNLGTPFEPRPGGAEVQALELQIGFLEMQILETRRQVNRLEKELREAAETAARENVSPFRARLSRLRHKLGL